MNIYLHIEVAAREFDSKLLLATLAAARGHQVILSDLDGIIQGVEKKILAPGIFHTKSITPSKQKISTLQLAIDNGFKVSSIDEETGFVDSDYKEFALERFSEQTVEQASAVFTWGDTDTEVLKRIYPNHSFKIHMTGSPRVDLWGSLFSEYWTVPQKIPKRPFLLISSNFSNTTKHFHQEFKGINIAGYFKRNPNRLKNFFGRTAEDYNNTAAFIEAIKHLSKYNNGYDIVLRPHPIESIEAWNMFLEGIPNVHVIREGPITPWIKSSFATMHNGCTTALEGIVSEKPVVTYVPFPVYYKGELPNKLGQRVESLEKLLHTVNTIFDKMKSNNPEGKNKTIPEILSKKLYIDNNELAALKIIKVWEKLNNKELSKIPDWKKFHRFLKIMKFRRILRNLIKKLYPYRYVNEVDVKKFPPEDIQDFQVRATRLQNILGIDKKLEYKLLSDRTILVRRL